MRSRWNSRPIARLATPLATPPSLAKGLVISGDCLFLGPLRPHRPVSVAIPALQRCYVARTFATRDAPIGPSHSLVLPGHQYQLPENGQTPTTMALGETVLRNQRGLAWLLMTMIAGHRCRPFPGL